MTLITSFVFVLLIGLLPAVALSRSVLGIALSAPVVLVISAIGASVAVAMGFSVVRSIAAFALLANVVAGVWLFRTAGRRRDETPRENDGLGLGLAIWFTAPSVLLLTLFPVAPLAWDARSIWWFRASWFQYGGEVVRDGLTNPAVEFSHPDYPAGVPAAIAALWRVTAGGAEDLWLAQAFSGVLTGLVIAGLALTLVYHHQNVGTIAAATALVAAAAHLGQGLAASGYVDVLSAALLTLALAAYVCLERPQVAVAAGSIALAGAAVTKNEGFVFGALVLLVAVVATRHDRRVVALAGCVALAPAVLWSILVRIFGTSSNRDLGAGNPVVRLLEEEGRTRLLQAGPAVIRETYLMVGPALIVWALLAASIWRAGNGGFSSLSVLRPAFALLSMAVGSAVVTALVYATGVPDMDWWLLTSLERVSATPKLFALAAIVAMTPISINLYHGSHPETGADRFAEASCAPHEANPPEPQVPSQVD